MKIRTYKYIADEKYFVNIRNEDFSENDLQLTWALPDKYAKIKQGFQPFVTFFDARTFGQETDDRAMAYIATITTRIEETILALRELEDNYTSETITNV